MSNTVPSFSPMQPGDSDTFAEDCTDELTRRADTIVSVGQPTITRTDNFPMGSGDLIASSIVVLAAGLKFGWRSTGGVAGVTYRLSFVLTLASGNTIGRTSLIPVAQAVG